jgi:chromate transport protein ChrA
MEFNIFSYLLLMLLAGLGSFGGGIGGTNILRDFAMNWNWIEQEIEMTRMMSLMQFNGYSQGIMMAGYLGNRGGNFTDEFTFVPAGLGIVGVILGVIAFLLPSLLFIIIILKIGEKLYKNNVFNYSIRYINLLAAGMICVMLYQYMVAVFGIDMIFFMVAAGLAFYLNLFHGIKPVYIVLGGVLLGFVWEIMPAMRDM